MGHGCAKAATSHYPISEGHAAVLFAYTEETPLYGTLNRAMRTPSTPTDPTDAELRRYADYIVHLQGALSTLPTHVSSAQGMVYRGIRALLRPTLYAPGMRVTWQAFASSTKQMLNTLIFVDRLPGRRLAGSIFIIESITAKDIRHYSAIPSEEEVLFPPNSQFLVQKTLQTEQEKLNMLADLAAYDMSDLDVYVLKQVA
jgi:hypothetical protein